MTSKLSTVVRRMRRHGIAPRRQPDPPSRLGRGPHGISTTAVGRRLFDVLRARVGSRRH
ncbi:hypothetical protein [Streptomyces peucetius]|uniref:Integrase n=1 Tax=Streptomyces peucetius TaxID=1950 RepID=A0ABY6I0Q5_STRPE|nr:hypothetical protein [Streptomyces peucetius]UYQ60558.1 hypothetical protein OGH68_03115 [Streptomyces peucetius]